MTKSKLKLENIQKTYKIGNQVVDALKGISLSFRDSEFVSILGPSGCGKTTMLNIIGGLDRYDDGDLVINDTSTKAFKNSDWDAYRNRSIGFVFQNYNLISHQNVLRNVEISMTLSGVSAGERRRRAVEALESVGLSDQINKKPNQLSGGQMQRVAIARALVNNPDIILADEPTGALDSKTSVQVMEILKKISETRLVIMVTHNSEMADEYSNRVVRLLDGEVVSDSAPVKQEEKIAEKQEKNTKKRKKSGLKKTSMSLFTATLLSFKNLLTKKGRTIITSFAGSIGIIGVALVLALSSGLTAYINTMQSDALAGFPITITQTEQQIMMTDVDFDDINYEFERFTDEDVIHSFDMEAAMTGHINNLTDEYFEHVARLEEIMPEAVNAISYTRVVGINVLANANDNVVKLDTRLRGMPEAMMNPSFWHELTGSDDFILSQYDLIGQDSRLPRNKNEVVLMVDRYNRIGNTFFQQLGFSEGDEFALSDFIGQSMLRVIPNDDYYSRAGDLFVPAAVADYEGLFESENVVEITVVGVLRPNENNQMSMGNGFFYTTELTDYIVANAESSEIATAQKDSEVDVLLGTPFADEEARTGRLLSLGAVTTPVGISIFPVDFEGKERIKEHLDAFNEGRAEEDRVIYTDLAEQITDMVSTLINVVRNVLVSFAAISLLVSTVMISIITYVSVIERTKEIGILRSVGARKKDISRVFKAETLIIGFIAGALGVTVSYLLTFPINAVIYNLVQIEGIAELGIIHAAALVAGSMLLTLIAGLIPSKMAANKDPVVALRTE